MRMMVFMLVVPIVWIALHVYIDRRLLPKGTSSAQLRRLLRWGVVLCAVLPVLTMVGGRALGLDGDEFRRLQLIGFTLLGFSSIVVALLLFVDLARVIAAGWRRVQLRLRA
ncbi:MAG: hypothetical protein IAG13_01030, partial [Deltaproteobacteria bacterium]|nr:hypothetical protein [Nannocystaceae bacterium]